MLLTGKARLAGVMGWPIGHSRSPALHGHWFRRYGIVANPASNANNLLDQPQRLVLPDVHSRQHTPTGRIGLGRNAAGTAVAFSLGALPPTGTPAGQVFTYDGTGILNYVAGNKNGGSSGC